jgi:hypothetical protein
MTRAAWVILAGDVAALFAFGLIGLASHDDAVTLKPIARSILPFVVLWAITAPFIGVLKPYNSRSELARAWIIAGITALIARSVFFDRELVTVFAGIAFFGNFLFIYLWRALYDFLASRGILPAS